MDKHLSTITTNTLISIVSKILDTSDPHITTWERETISGGTGGAIGGTALYRFYGKTKDMQVWSTVLKILYARPDETTTSPYYWKREYEVYRSGMLDNLPDGKLVPPTIYGFEDFGESCWIWMEDIKNEKVDWELEDYGDVARHLGRFNGAYLTKHDLPDYDWLTHDWHCSIVPALSDAFENLEKSLKHPLAQRTLPIQHKETILTIWENRKKYQDALKTLPQTLCHIDAFKRNLLYRQDDIVLIDWAIVGHGRIGEELVCLMSLSQYLDRFEAYPVEDLDKLVFENYVKGLRDAGWTGNATLARIGYTCAMVLRGLAGVKQDINYVLDESKHNELQGNFQTDMDGVADLFAQVRTFRLLRMAEEANNFLS